MTALDERPAVTGPARSIPRGLCQCGCGRRTRRYLRTDRKTGVRAGEFARFAQGHNARVAGCAAPPPGTSRQRRTDPPDPDAPADAERCSACGCPFVANGYRGRPPTGWRRKTRRGLCATCDGIAEAEGTLIDHPRRYRTRDEVLDEWEHLRVGGATRAEAAERMGMTLLGLEMALYRARRDEDPRAVWGERGTPWRTS